MPPKKRRTVNKPFLGSNALMHARNPGESTSIFPIAKRIKTEDEASSPFLSTDDIQKIMSSKMNGEDADLDSVSNTSDETVAVDFEETKKTQQHLTVKTEPPENDFNNAALPDARTQDQVVHIKIKSEPLDNDRSDLNHSDDKTQKKKIMEEKIQMLKQNILSKNTKIKSEPNEESIEDNNNSQDATIVNKSENFTSAFSTQLLVKFSHLTLEFDTNDLNDASEFLAKTYGHLTNKFQVFNDGNSLSGDTALCNDTLLSDDTASVTVFDPVIPVKTSEIGSQQTEKPNNSLSNGGQISAQSKNHVTPVTLPLLTVQDPKSSAKVISSTDSSFRHPDMQPSTSTSNVILNTLPKQNFPSSSSYLSNTLISHESSSVPGVSNWTTEHLQEILKSTTRDPVAKLYATLNSCDLPVDRNVTANTDNTLKRNLSSIYEKNYFTGDISQDSVCSGVTQRDSKKPKVSSSHCLPVRDPPHSLPVRNPPHSLPVRNPPHCLPVRDPPHSLPVSDPRVRRNSNPVFSPRKGDRDLQLYLNVGRDIFDQTKFCRLILQWNPEWLHTQDETNVCPPIFDLETYRRSNGVKYNYNDATEYYNTYVPLLLLSVWCKMFDNWKNRRGFLFSSTMELSKEETENFFKYVCFFEFPNTDLAPKKDNIVLCQFRTGKLLFMRISNMSTRNNTGHPNPKQKPNVRFELVSVEKVNMETEEEVTLFVIYNCRIAVLQNKSLKKLNPSVEPVILKPSIHLNRIAFMELELPVDELASQALKTWRDRILNVAKQNFVTLLDLKPSIGNPSGNPGPNYLKVIKYLAYILYKDENYNVLICMEKEDAFKDMVSQMRPYDPVLLVRASEVQFQDNEIVKLILEKRVQNDETATEIIAKRCNIFITLLSAYKDDIFIRKKLKTACIIHNAHLCTETDTVLPLIVRQLDRLLLFGNQAGVPDVPKSLKQFDYNLSLYTRLLRATRF